jgi:hypothetical protein
VNVGELSCEAPRVSSCLPNQAHGRAVFCVCACTQGVQLGTGCVQKGTDARSDEDHFCSMQGVFSCCPPVEVPELPYPVLLWTRILRDLRVEERAYAPTLGSLFSRRGRRKTRPADVGFRLTALRVESNFHRVAVHGVQPFKNLNRQCSILHSKGHPIMYQFVRYRTHGPFGDGYAEIRQK